MTSPSGNALFQAHSHKYSHYQLPGLIKNSFWEWSAFTKDIEPCADGSGRNSPTYMSNITQIISVYSLLVLYRKYEGRISTSVAFCLLLGQKFMSIVIGKVSLYGELPTLRDSSFLVLLGIHFVTFTLFHTHTGEDIMNKIKWSEIRIVVQETFKGYGKGLSLISLVNKGMKLHTNPLYFILVLFIRGSASALFKSTCVSFLLKKRIKVKKAKINFIFITIPSLALFIAKFILRRFVETSKSSPMEQSVVHFFVLFMVISRCLRALVKILEHMKGTKGRKRTRNLERLQPLYLSQSDSNAIS